MRNVMLASVRVYARRYVAAVVAVSLAVAFIVAANAVTSAARAGLLDDLRASFRGGDVVVSGVTGPAVAERAVRTAESAGGQGVTNALTWTRAAGGQLSGDDVQVGTIAGADTVGLRWQPLRSGSYPGPGEVVLDVHEAAQRGIEIGDTLTLGAGRRAHDLLVSGTVASSTGPHAAIAYVTWPDFRGFADAVVVQDVVTREVAPAALTESLPGRLVAEPLDRHLATLQQAATRGVDVVGVVLIGFAAIALFVAVLVIANTFTVLLAQRQRDLALLRCVGATGRQVRRALAQEALLVGAGSAALGLLVGVVLGRAAVEGAGALLPSVPFGAADLSAPWLVGGWLVGVLVTPAATVLPARRGSRVSPLSALHADAAPPARARSRAAVGRISLAVLALGAGVAMLWWSMTSHGSVAMLAGGFVSIVGVLLLGPLLVPAVIRLVGQVVGRLAGPTGRLAVANAVRNPGRTAATAASLLVGTTLITGMVVGVATVRSAVAQEMDQQYPLDLTLTGSRPLDDRLTGRVAAVEGVGRAVPVRGATGALTVRGDRLPPATVLAAPDDAGALVHGRPGFASVRPGQIWLSWEGYAETGYREGMRVVVTVDGRRTVLRARVTDGIGADVAVVDSTTLDRLAPAARPRALWIRAAEGADAEDLHGALTALSRATGLAVAGGLERRAFMDLQLDVVLGAALAMLAVGVLIAVVGVGSTLGLSVLERGREHALLRALGLTRRRLRLMLSAEAVLLAGVAGLLGAALGTVYAWVGVESVLGRAFGDLPLVVPWSQVGLVTLVAALAGLLAGVLPARRGAATPPAAGLAAA